jgi:8-oxo-dGTP pyrophosphatase MutT (NUDIX family)
VCYRFSRGSIEFLLVRTRSGKWTFPKGNIEPHLTLHESAQLEAYEEAGAMGRIARVHFDEYLHLKETGVRGLVVAAYLLEVDQTVPPQELHRTPTWFSAREAKSRLATGRMRGFQREFSRVIDNALTTLHAGRHFASKNSRLA